MQGNKHDYQMGEVAGIVGKHFERIDGAADSMAELAECMYEAIHHEVVDVIVKQADRKSFPVALLGAILINTHPDHSPDYLVVKNFQILPPGELQTPKDLTSTTP